MNTQKFTGFQEHMHVFRGIAILLIVCAHTLPALDWSQQPLVGRLIDAVANESSVLFFFIAGYLFQHLSANYRFGTYLRQKLVTIFVPYLAVSIPALVLFTAFVPRLHIWPWFYDLPVWQQVSLFLLTGKHLAPLWFVPTIGLIYLLSPVFVHMDRKWTWGYWAIVPLLLLGTYLGRNGPIGPPEKALYLLPIYLLGMAVSHYKPEALALIHRWRWLLLAVLLVSLTGFVLELGEPPYYQLPAKAALALLGTSWLWSHHEKLGGRLHYIGHISFGIFFIHSYLISGIKVATHYLSAGQIYKGADPANIPGNLLNFMLYATCVLALSVLLIWLMQKLLGAKSRLFVGA